MATGVQSTVTVDFLVPLRRYLCHLRDPCQLEGTSILPSGRFV